MDVVGVGPHEEPWPDDPRLDPELLAAGDRRNVVDRYRYWRRDAIIADLDTHRHGFQDFVLNATRNTQWRDRCDGMRHIGAHVRHTARYMYTIQLRQPLDLLGRIGAYHIELRMAELGAN